MSRSQSLRRFRINPVELAIFSVTLLMFLHSVYNLVYTQGGFQPNALVAMSSNPISEGRSLASGSQSLLTLSLQCDETNQVTQANKVRLNGQLCGLNPP